MYILYNFLRLNFTYGRMVIRGITSSLSRLWPTLPMHVENCFTLSLSRERQNFCVIKEKSLAFSNQRHTFETLAEVFISVSIRDMSINGFSIRDVAVQIIRISQLYFPISFK